jgi:hypothetical protein
MTKFEIGKYYSRSTCNHDVVFEIEVLRRTKHFIIIRNPHARKETKRVKVYNSELFDGNQVELCNALGRYSMAPIFNALDKVR